MSNTSKNSGDSPDRSPGASSEKKPEQTAQRPDAVEASELPAYMRTAAETPADSEAAPPADETPAVDKASASSQKTGKTDELPDDWDDVPAGSAPAADNTAEVPILSSRENAAPDAEIPEPAMPESAAPKGDSPPAPGSSAASTFAASKREPANEADKPAFAPPGSIPPPERKTSRPAAGTVFRPSFAATHPMLTVNQTMPASLGSRLYNALAVFPLVPLTVMLILQTIFTLDARGLWFSDEIRHAAAFHSLLDQGKWLILEMNGQVYPDKPPLYFLFLRGLYEWLRTDGPMLHFTAAAVSALLYLWAALGLGACAARVDRRTNLAAGIILLSIGYVMGMMHYARMDLLFSALILCSHVALYRAFVSPSKKWAGMILGFFLAGLAALVKGPLGLAMPLCSLVVFAVWRGLPQRLFRPDFLLGLIFGLIPVAAWLGAIYWTTGNLDFILNSLIKQQVIERAVDTFHHKEAWYYYLTRLPLMFLPWTLLVFFLPWGRFLGKNMRAAVAASRKPEAEGLGFLWSMVISALVLLSLLSGKILVYFLPALPALTILAARALMGLEGARAGGFRKCMALLMLLGGVAIVVASLMLFGLLPTPDLRGLPQWKLASNGAFFIVAAILLLISGLLWTGLRSNRPEGPLLVMALAAVVLGYPLAGLVAPSFDAVLSPKAQALMMRAYIQDGYAPAEYRVYGGTYTFYAGTTVPSIKELPAAESGKMVIGMQRSRLSEWENKPDCFKEVHSQWIETREYVLMACPAKEGMKPAAVPYAPGPDFLGDIMKRLGIPWPPQWAKPAIPEPATPEPAAPDAPKAPEAAPEKSAPVPDQPVPGETKAPVPAMPEQPAAEPAAPEQPVAPKQDAPAAPEQPAAPLPDQPAPGEIKAPEAPAPADAPAEPATPEQGAPKPDAPAVPEQPAAPEAEPKPDSDTAEREPATGTVPAEADPSAPTAP